jgi:hypothetical protein
LSYLSRIENDYIIDAERRRTAQEIYKLLGMSEGAGIMAGARMHSASEAALEMYSPRANARIFV